jgi:RNA polymerase sigma-70 factor (ECF subfamily)
MSSAPADLDEPDALVRAATGGDRRAIERVLQQVFPRVLRTCRGILGRTAEAEDAAQESLIEIARALPRFRGEGSVSGYATRITIRTAMRMRKQARPPAVSMDEAREPVAPEHGPDDAVVGQRRRQVLRALLDTLPSEQAETVVLRFLLGHGLEEVATITETPRNTVRSRLRLAKTAIARKISEDEQLRELLGVDE